MNAFIPMLLSFGLVFLMIPLWRRAAMAWGFVDQPGGRKIHVAPIPLLGGPAIYIGAALAMAAFDGWTARTQALTVGGALLMVTGLIDDWHKTRRKEFAVWPRVLLYLAVSAVPPLYGIRITGMTRWFAPEAPGMIMFEPWLGWLATVIWIFGLINMFNFIDGVDGLAAGIAGIAAVTLFVIAMIMGQPGPALTAMVIAGASVAFWVYNMHPAKIFMGDAGATFLGYGLALVTVEGALKGAALVSLLPPVLALGVPILDTGIVMLRRLAGGSGLHKADQMHTHHSLMKWGLSQTQTVSFLYLIGVIFSLLSILVVVVIEW